MNDERFYSYVSGGKETFDEILEAIAIKTGLILTLGVMASVTEKAKRELQSTDEMADFVATSAEKLCNMIKEMHNTILDETRADWRKRVGV